MMHLTQCPWLAADLGAVVTECGAIYRSQLWICLLLFIVAELTFQSQPLTPS